MTRTPPALAALCAGLLLACNAPAPSPAPTPASVAASKPQAGAPAKPNAAVAPAAGLPADTLVTVNGVPITEADVKAESKGDVHGALPDEGKRKAVLDGLVRRELFRQAALERKLDAEAEYVKRRAILEAQIRTFERTELPAALRRDLLAKAAVTEADARAWYAANEAIVGTEVHVMQLLAKSRPAAEALKAKLDAGTPFEAVAAGLFPNLPAAVKAPWDLGYLHWGQMPAPWLDVVYKTPDGQVTPIIEGPGGRFWILRVVEKRKAEAAVFDAIAPAVIDRLKAERVGVLESELEKTLRERARVQVIARPAEPVDE